MTSKYVANLNIVPSPSLEQYDKQKLGQAQFALAWGLISIGFGFLTSPGIITAFLIQVKKIIELHPESIINILPLSTFSTCFLWAFGHTLGEGLSQIAWDSEKEKLGNSGASIWSRNLLKEFVGFLFFIQEWLVSLNTWHPSVSHSIFTMVDSIFRLICLIGGIAGIFSLFQCFVLGASGITYFIGLTIILLFLTPVLLTCALTSFPRYTLLFFGQGVLLLMVIFDWCSNGFSIKLFVLVIAVHFILMVAVRMVRNSLNSSWFSPLSKKPNLVRIGWEFLKMAKSRAACGVSRPKTFLSRWCEEIFR